MAVKTNSTDSIKLINEKKIVLVWLTLFLKSQAQQNPRKFERKESPNSKFLIITWCQGNSYKNKNDFNSLWTTHMVCNLDYSC